jgi:hypothetical protein
VFADPDAPGNMAQFIFLSPGRDGAYGARVMTRSGAPVGAGTTRVSASLLRKVGVRLGQVEGDRARRVVGDDPGGQVALVRALAACWYAEDACVVVGIGAEAELALASVGMSMRQAYQVWGQPRTSSRGGPSPPVTACRRSSPVSM